MDKPGKKLLRCAIYTRKSTDHNLDLEFNSLDAQREACEAYIKSQAHEGWRLIHDRYDDGAFSGASLDRPALQRLLTEVGAGKIDIIVVYKVDRLTRSLGDFAKLVELFDQHSVSFVSVTQSFNTTSSMGRLTLNVLLSFAQFEREVIGERVRDKIAASKAKGIWVGGSVPLGYASVNKKLVVVPEEAETVRLIFRRYLELGSIRDLVEDLDHKGIRTRRQVLSTGKIRGSIRFGVGPVAHLLRNRFYIGEIVYRGAVHPGEQEHILDRALFDAVQAKLDASVVRISAPDIETAVVQAVCNHLDKRKSGDRPNPTTDRELIERHVERIIVKPQMIEVHLVSEAGHGPAEHDQAIVAQHLSETAAPVAITVPWTMTAIAAAKGILHSPLPSPAMSVNERDVILTAIAKARAWIADLIEGRATSFAEISQREGKVERHIRLLAPLAFVSPRIIADIIDGILPSIAITDLAKQLPYCWARQEIGSQLDLRPAG